MEELPKDIFYVISKHGGEEIRNLKYTNRHFYKLLSDEHISHKIKKSKTFRVPIGIWDTKKFFIECIENRRFLDLVEFFNTQKRYLCKNTMLCLCMHFLSTKGLNKLLSRIEVPIGRSTVKINKYQSEQFNSIVSSYPHLFSSSYPLYYKDSFSISKTLTIDRLKARLQTDLERSKANTVDLQQLTLFAERYGLTQEQIDISTTTASLSEIMSLVFSLINGNTFQDILKLDNIQTINGLLTFTLGLDYYYMMNLLPIDTINELLENTHLLLRGRLRESEIIERKEVMNMIFQCILVHFPFDFANRIKSIITTNVTSIYNLNADSYKSLRKIEELFSEIRYETIVAIFQNTVTSTNHIILHLLIQYLKVCPTIEEEIDDQLSFLNRNLILAFEKKEYDLVAYICANSKVNLLVFVSYCYNIEKAKIHIKKAYRVISTFYSIVKICKDKERVLSVKKLIKFLEKKLE